MPGCRPSSTACASRTCRTSTSACRRGGHAPSRRAVDWTAARKPDLVCITGDLLSRAGGQAELDRLLERSADPYVVLGNHDVRALARPVLAAGRDRRADARHAALGLGGRRRVTRAQHRARGRRPTHRGSCTAVRLVSRAPQADLALLLCHFPSALYRVEPGRFHLSLAGHLHGGQIVLPYGFGRLLLAHPRSRTPRGCS